MDDIATDISNAITNAITIYEVTPTRGLAVGPMRFEQGEPDADTIRFRMTCDTWQVRRDTPEDSWERVS